MKVPTSGDTAGRLNSAAMLRRLVLLLVLSPALFAQTAEDAVAKYVAAIGGAEKLRAIQTIRRVGTFDNGAGIRAAVVEESKRPNRIRQEFTIGKVTAVTAYDGRSGWKIEPWEGNTSPQALSADELATIVADADFDGPLVDSDRKGHKVQYLGVERVGSTLARKLAVTLASGVVMTYYLDASTYLPLRIDTKRTVGGELRESETSLSDYREVRGVRMPFAYESGPKGATQRAKITFARIEANVALEEARFARPRR